MFHVVNLLVLVAYLVLLYRWKEDRPGILGRKMARLIKWVHYTALTFCLIALVLYIAYHLSFRGIWTTRIFIFTWLLTGLPFIFLATKAIVTRLEKLYFTILAFLPMLLSILSFVPFLGMILYYSLIGSLFMPVHNVYYDDPYIRIQSSFTGILASPSIDVIAKKSVFEEHVYRDEIMISDSDTLSVRHEAKRTYIYISNKEDKKTILIER